MIVDILYFLLLVIRTLVSVIFIYSLVFCSHKHVGQDTGSVFNIREKKIFEYTLKKMSGLKFETESPDGEMVIGPFKVLLVGDANVGKTSVLKRYKKLPSLLYL